MDDSFGHKPPEIFRTIYHELCPQNEVRFGDNGTIRQPIFATRLVSIKQRIRDDVDILKSASGRNARICFDDRLQGFDVRRMGNDFRDEFSVCLIN